MDSGCGCFCSLPQLGHGSSCSRRAQGTVGNGTEGVCRVQGHHLAFRMVVPGQILNSGHGTSLRDARLRNVPQVHGLPLLELRLFCPATACLQRDDCFGLQKLEALAKIGHLVALAFCGRDDTPQIAIGIVSHDDRIHHGTDGVDGLKSSDPYTLNPEP